MTRAIRDELKIMETVYKKNLTKSTDTFNF